MLDMLPPMIRHAIFAAASILIAALLQWVQTDYLNWNLPAGIVALIGFALPMLVAYLTPITRQYGLGGSPVVNIGHDEYAGPGTEDS